jgi:transcriptional regulator with XRE-family HTH domain
VRQVPVADRDPFVYYRRVAGRIRRHREARGWSQRELARRIGYSQASVKLWEQAKILPRVDAQIALAHAFAVHPDELFSFAFRGGDEE